MAEFGKAIRGLWQLDPAVIHLNHGAFGATPRAVLQAQQTLRDEIELSPSGYFGSQHFPRLRAAAVKVARWLGTPDDELAFVDNATAGANAVLRSLALAAGDEILVTDSTYGAITNAARHVAAAAGALLRTVSLDLAADEAELTLRLEAALGPRTRLAILDHVVSENGHVLPIGRLIQLCRRRGVPVLVDGAHAPGQFPFLIGSLDPDFYVANLHKWAFAPRSCGVLWARREWRDRMHPAVISWGYGQGMAAEFDWVGTRDFTPWLAAPAALEFLDGLGAMAVSEHNRDLAHWAGEHLADRLKTHTAVPAERSHAMLAVRLPGRHPATIESAATLRHMVWAEQRIDASIVPARGALWVRLCAQVYNTREDFETLGQVLAKAG